MSTKTYGESVKFPIGGELIFSVFKCDDWVNMSFRKCKVGGNGQIYFLAGGNNGVQLIMPQYRQLCADSGKITEALDDSVSTDPVVFNLPFNLTATIHSPTACAPKLIFLEKNSKRKVLS